MSEVSYTFTPNKYHCCLLNAQPNNLVFLKTYNTEFNDIEITFTDQNSTPIEDKVNLTLLIIASEYFERYGFLSFGRNVCYTKDNYWMLLPKHH